MNPTKTRLARGKSGGCPRETMSWCPIQALGSAMAVPKKGAARLWGRKVPVLKTLNIVIR
jgi:hypothetical protein